ncbi:type IX secretion system membrane protein PorP/SprF [Lutibacter sp.]|uniref:PorP/SprF family type IX secretion system membrane protein n=1 Tax=Lutibacter sp. TaxID=1925666 RepID=UPI003565D3DD
MKSVKFLLKLFVFVFSITTMHSQQDAQYTQYMYNMHILNPAYAGSEGTLNISVLGRNQWVGIDGAPKTLTASINAPVGRNVGLGFSVIADKIGPVKEQNVYADFSYNLQVGDYSNLAFGIKGGFTFLNADLVGLDLGDNVSDDAFLENIDRTMGNVGVGLFYYSDKFYLGASVPNLLKSLQFKKKNGYIYDYKAIEELHYFITSGYIFEVSNNLKLKPSIMAKAVNGAPLSLDFSGNALINEKLEFGLSWRLDDSVSAMFNVLVSPNTRIGYAYDYTLSNLGDFNSGSHEVFLLFNISNSRAGLSPRFF